MKPVYNAVSYVPDSFRICLIDKLITGLRVIRPGVPIFNQNRSLSKSQTGNSDKSLPPYRSQEMCQKYRRQCSSIYDPLKAKAYGLNNGKVS